MIHTKSMNDKMNDSFVRIFLLHIYYQQPQSTHDIPFKIINIKLYCIRGWKLDIKCLMIVLFPLPYSDILSFIYFIMMSTV